MKSRRGFDTDWTETVYLRRDKFTSRTNSGRQGQTLPHRCSDSLPALAAAEPAQSSEETNAAEQSRK